MGGSRRACMGVSTHLSWLQVLAKEARTRQRGGRALGYSARWFAPAIKRARTSSQVKSSQAKPSHAKPSQVKSRQGKSTQASPSQVKSPRRGPVPVARRLVQPELPLALQGLVRGVAAR